jgi:hypothetical protein
MAKGSWLTGKATTVANVDPRANRIKTCQASLIRFPGDITMCTPIGHKVASEVNAPRAAEFNDSTALTDFFGDTLVRAYATAKPRTRTTWNLLNIPIKNIGGSGTRGLTGGDRSVVLRLMADKARWLTRTMARVNTSAMATPSPDRRAQAPLVSNASGSRP